MFNSAAAWYLRLRLKVDKQLVDDITIHGFTIDNLNTLFSEYRVHRTIPGQAPDRLEALAGALNELPPAASVPDTVHNLVQQGFSRIGGLKSALDESAAPCCHLR
jgi:hypothetical protein